LRCRALRLLFASAALLICETALAGETCTYTDWAWHVPSGQCSICIEDMTEVNVPGQQPVLMCHVIAPAVEAALIAAQDSGFEIESLTGYRVGRTKGSLDEDGRRTEYSHHSFGLAIDINADKNGLYDRCIEFGPACRLRRGGRTSAFAGAVSYKAGKKTLCTSHWRGINQFHQAILQYIQLHRKTRFLLKYSQLFLTHSTR